MNALGSLPESLKAAVEHGVLKRLPTTFLPFANQQLREWEYLFPNERQSTERLLLYVDSLTPEQSSALFRNVLDLEDKMEVRSWKFSTSEQTIENASLLARSSYYQQWRSAVQAVFDAADRYAQRTGNSRGSGNRTILLSLPHPLALNAADPWRRWQNAGRAVELDASGPGQSDGVLETLLLASPAQGSTSAESLLGKVASRPGHEPADTWIIDAGRGLIDRVITHPLHAGQGTDPILLSYSRLDQYRESFSHEMNTMRKDLTDADAVYDRLRNVDVKPWCPPEAENAAVREYLRTLYLSGNGAVIFGNSFVQWGASEALRRARPRFLAAKFSVRSKPKPFTGVAVFDNPDQINPLPAVDDVPGSTIDAQILAAYIWLAAARYGEYQSGTACVCIAESLSQAYLVAPPEFPISAQTSRVSVDQLSGALRQWTS
ncbi:hypothetical protein DYQ86_02085 [Acidobacteria bacterium AB60]|nr:hypothetical protein DYQ86_02085 [Acidobacteria bacterium AB60]